MRPVWTNWGGGGGGRLSKSVLDKTRVSKKEENLSIDVLRVLEGRKSIISRRYFNLRYIRWIAVVTGIFHPKTIKINDTVCCCLLQGTSHRRFIPGPSNSKGGYTLLTG